VAARYPFLFGSETFESEFLTSIQRVAAETVGRLRGSALAAASNRMAGDYLLLQRSPQPRFYEEGGGAENPTYGTARRSLSGVPKAVQQLQERGIAIRVFEPGRHRLAEQILAFTSCRGIVGIIGAEFANVIWMKARAKVVFIRPPCLDLPSLTETLSRMLDLDFVELPAESSSHPELDAESVSSALTSDCPSEV
jgi:hypothetical protein